MRIWKNDTEDDGSIHCLGNGHVCAYEQGPNIVQVFGPPYSSPSLLKLEVSAGQPIAARSQREPGAAIWTHTLTANGEPLGELLDYVAAGLPCLVRRMRLSQPVRFHLAPGATVRVVNNTARWGEGNGGLLLEAPSGTYLYHTYPFPTPIFHQIVWRGPVQLATAADGYELICGPGECELFFAGGPDYPSAITAAENALRVPGANTLAWTRQYWQVFTRSRRDFAALLPAGLACRDELLRVIDDVAVLIKAQQSAEGAVLAGHNYHMGYVRDQYGVARGLLAMGHVAEARAILEFYWRVWQRHGRIHNAQAAGVNGVFHVHENDEVEITGYLIRQAFDLLAAHRDADAFIGTIAPMLAWAWESQKKHLVDGMLPFNGDETYVAGGILPRHTLNDGSAEATLLFVDGGEKWLNWVEAHGRQLPASLAGDRALLADVRARYRGNFWRDGQIITNNPRRAAQANLPRFRHGVCERCVAEGRARGIEWTERNAAGRYVCPACLAGDPYPAAEAKVFVLQSVSLTPLYFGSSLFEAGELAPLVQAIVERYRRTGKLPSRQDDDASARSQAVGYDYGLLLYALATLGDPFAPELCRAMLSLVDATGAWVEYYVDHRPMGTRCRPWESAVNIDAAVKWALRVES